MKTSIKYLVILATLLCCVYAHSQERVDSEGYSLKNKSQLLKKATFWQQGSNGKWESWRNNVTDDGVNRRDNFITLCTGELNINGDDFYILLKTYWQGKYRYPNIKEDWGNYKTVEGYVLHKDQFDKLKNIESGEIVEITSETIYNMPIGDHYEESDILQMLSINKGLKTIMGEKETIATIMIAKRVINKNKDVIRFQFSPIFFGNTKHDVENFYFETDKKEFDKLFQAK